MSADRLGKIRHSQWFLDVSFSFKAARLSSRTYYNRHFFTPCSIGNEGNSHSLLGFLATFAFTVLL